MKGSAARAENTITAKIRLPVFFISHPPDYANSPAHSKPQLRLVMGLPPNVDGIKAAKNGINDSSHPLQKGILPDSRPRSLPTTKPTQDITNLLAFRQRRRVEHEALGCLRYMDKRPREHENLMRYDTFERAL